MKPFTLTLLLAACLTLTACVSMTPKQGNYYELVGGDNRIDFIDFINDSTVRFMAPGHIEKICPYTKEGNRIRICVSPLVIVDVLQADDETIQGTPPFFEGTWKKTAKPQKAR